MLPACTLIRMPPAGENPQDYARLTVLGPGLQAIPQGTPFQDGAADSQFALRHGLCSSVLFLGCACLVQAGGLLVGLLLRMHLLPRLLRQTHVPTSFVSITASRA